MDEELLAVRDLRGQRRRDGVEGERQVRQGPGALGAVVNRPGNGVGELRLLRVARVEAEPAPLAADLLIQSREEPALVGVGIVMREAPRSRFV